MVKKRRPAQQNDVPQTHDTTVSNERAITYGPLTVVISMLPQLLWSISPDGYLDKSLSSPISNSVVTTVPSC